MLTILLIGLGALLLSFYYKHFRQEEEKEDNEDSYNHCAEADYDYFNRRCL